MYITSIGIKNFLSFGNDTKIDFKDLNIIVGPNNSGKTNILRAINFVGDAFAHRIEEVDAYYHDGDLEHPFEVSIGIRFNDEEKEALSSFLICYGLTNLYSANYENELRKLIVEFLISCRKEFFTPLFENVTLIVQAQSQQRYPVILIQIRDSSGRELYIHEYGTISLYPYEISRSNMSFLQILSEEVRSNQKITNFLAQHTSMQSLDDQLPNVFDLVRKNIDMAVIELGRADFSIIRGIIKREQRSRTVPQLIKLKNFLEQRGFTNDSLNIFELITTIYNSAIIRTSNIRTQRKAFLNLPEREEVSTITANYLSGEELPLLLFRLKNSTELKEREKYSKIRDEFREIVNPQISQESVSEGFDVCIRPTVVRPKPSNELALVDGSSAVPPQQPEGDIKLLAIKTRQEKITLNELVIQIVEGKRAVPLEYAGAGLFEILVLLAALLGHEEKVILLDEPALNLHPILQKRFLRLAKEAISHNNNQIAIISHSPYFIDYDIVSRTNQTISTSVLYVRKQDNSSVVLMPDNIQLELKPHLFRPEIFFSQCNIIVEGPGDLATLSAISEGYDDILGKYDIALINTWGKGGVKKYLPLLNSYKIPFVAMVDSDYDDPNDDNVITLEKDLEWELEKLGWKEKSKKVESTEAYEFISSIIKEENGKQKIRESKLWEVIQRAINKTELKSK